MKTGKNLEDRYRLLEIAKARGKDLLDIGVGPLTVIAARDFGCRVTSIDVSEEALQKARAEAKEEGLVITFERHDATDLPYGDNSFDVVVSCRTLHHIPPGARKTFISEAYRVAREKIVIADYNEVGFPHGADEYEIVDFRWLEEELSLLSEMETHEDGKINIYICNKEKSISI